MTNITVFASHGGSDMQAIIDGCKSGAINGRVVAVISNNADSYALVRAQKEGIDRYHIAHDQILLSTAHPSLNNTFLRTPQNPYQKGSLQHPSQQF